MTSPLTFPVRLVLSVLILLGITCGALADDFEKGVSIVKDRKQMATQATQAEDAFRAVVKDDPNRYLAWYNLGLLAHRRGDNKAARKAWKRALKANKNYLPARARLMELRLKAAKTDEDRAKAIAKLKEIVTCPEDVDCDKIAGKNRYQPEARNILAEVAIAEERWDDAARHARNVLLGDPDNINAYVNMAVTYYRQGMVEQTWLIVSNALQRRPEAAALHNLMGLVHLGWDDSSKATKSFLRALAEDPLLVEAKMNLAALELSYGDFESALKRFDEVLAQKKDDPMVVLSRAVTLRGLERYDEAASAYEEALKLRPEMTEPVYNLCILHQQYTNQWDKAKHYCEKFAEGLERRHPKRREMRSRIAGIEATLEALKEAEAAEAAEEAERREAEKPDAPNDTPPDGATDDGTGGDGGQ